MLALVVVLPSDAGASAARVVPLPSVSATSGEAIQDGKMVVRVRTLLIQRLYGVRKHPKWLIVSCNRCQRLRTPIVKDYPTPTSKLFAGVNWLLREGRGFRVTVVRPGHVGRFVRLIARRRGARLRLSYRDSGCVDSRRRTVRCPRGSERVAPGRPVPQPPSANQPSAPPPGEQPVVVAPPPPPPPAGARAVCSDGLDNDGDGKIDYPNDPGCSSATDGAEKEAVCSDGLDNDGDGKIDFPQDPGCSSPEGPAEQPPACSDGLDNDGDGKIDYPNDPGCSSASDGAEKG